MAIMINAWLIDDSLIFQDFVGVIIPILPKSSEEVSLEDKKGIIDEFINVRRMMTSPLKFWHKFRC